jgi:tetratricopeptide (TPR) repeat protein
MAARGDSAYFEGDFERAQHAYRGALMLQDDPLHRIRFIDALSQLALRANATGELTRARKLIDEAREWDNTSLPHRALLALADDLMPRVDHRARLGLILLIAVLGVIVTLRLVRLLSEPRHTPRGSTHTTPNAHREGSP